MSQLVKLKLAARRGKAVEIFESICPDIFANPHHTPSQFINDVWSKYMSIEGVKENAINGTIFEYAIASVLLREEIRPFHKGAELSYVPNVRYDIILLSNSMQIFSLSLKTSLRERYKQADLEAMALKNVHRRAKSYLVTLDHDETPRLQKKIEGGDMLALDEVILATGEEFDRLIEELRVHEYINNIEVGILERSSLVI